MKKKQHLYWAFYDDWDGTTTPGFCWAYSEEEAHTLLVEQANREIAKNPTSNLSKAWKEWLGTFRGIK